MSYEVARVLQDAAEVLEKEGWTQDNYKDQYGYCALGSINMALGVAATAMDSHQHLATAALEDVIGTPFVATWNDSPGRTKDEVLDAFHAAAKQEMRKADGLL